MNEQLAITKIGPKSSLAIGSGEVMDLQGPQFLKGGLFEQFT